MCLKLMFYTIKKTYHADGYMYFSVPQYPKVYQVPPETPCVYRDKKLSYKTPFGFIVSRHSLLN